MMREEDLAESALDAIQDVGPEAAVYWPGPLAASCLRQGLERGECALKKFFSRRFVF